jgi:hypothetical protein
MERPGNAGNKFFLRADLRVDKAGENKAAWAKATSCAGLADWLAVLACCVTGGGVGSQRVRVANWWCWQVNTPQFRDRRMNASEYDLLRKLQFEITWF